MSFFNKLKNKAEELNTKHNILPFGQNQNQNQNNQTQQGQAPSAPHQTQTYPGQSQYPAYQQQQQQPPPPSASWQQPAQTTYGNYYAQAPPPPVPFHSRPGGGAGGVGGVPLGGIQQTTAAAAAAAVAPPQIYWRPDFNPAVPVSQTFDQKQGHGDPWGWGNSELQNYTSSAANSFHTPDGKKLVVRALSQPSHRDPEARYTSARLVTRATLGRADGCLSAVLSLPCAEGIWPAFWLLPREPFAWPREGEVDVAETWNGDCRNHACLHWGFYGGGAPEEAAKHLVRETHVPDMAGRPLRFDFAWRCGGGGGGGGAEVRPSDGKSAGGGRLLWYVDGRPVMRNRMPAGTRPIEDWCVLLNVAMGGNVCQGKTPREGAYDLVVHDLHMSDAPEGGWGKFEHDWQWCADGAVM